MSLLRLVGLSHRTAPVAWRERFAVPEDRLPAFLDGLHSRAQVQETVVLSTCNRVEVYAVTEPTDEAPLRRELTGLHKDPGLADCFYSLEGAEAVRHLFRVSAGLDSLVIGEAEILGQVKRAYDFSKRAGRTGKLTNVLFQRALYVGKLVRSATRISEGPTSVPALGVSLAERIFGRLSGARVLVVGAGAMAEAAARAFQSQKAKLSVSNRTFENAAALAERFGASAIPFDQRYDALHDADVVLSSTGAPEPIFRAAAVAEVMKERRGRALFFIDIAVPRDVEPAVNDLENAYLYSVDDLESLVAENMAKRGHEIEKADALALAKAAEFSPWYEAWRAGVPAALRHSGDATMEAS